MYSRLAGGNKEKSPEHIGDPPRTVFRMALLRFYNPLTHLSGNPGFAASTLLGAQARFPATPVCFYLPRDRMPADSELLLQYAGAVALFEIQTYHFQPQFVRIGPGPLFGFPGSALSLAFLFIDSYTQGCYPIFSVLVCHHLAIRTRKTRRRFAPIKWTVYSGTTGHNKTERVVTILRNDWSVCAEYAPD